MKKYIFILFVFTSICSFAQTDYTKIVMKTDADFKAADKYALEASNYILSVPIDKNDITQLKAVRFIINWMEGTPDYTFNIVSPSITKLTQENESFLGIFYAGMTKYTLENPTKAEDMKAVQLNGFKSLVAFAEKAEHKVAITPTLKKLLDANKKGELEKGLE
ncbi:hypothetical protein [Flavobacterium sp.]|uniref:hypothetical protein n=1 Tax=Flavobacterium sp. TaxID=239 RepID=UPI0024890EB8|nr:hypothetical protein [Flavobacterium sp.]MDI1315995.1 hypothetical protein [Flavobacterium sp.]